MSLLSRLNSPTLADLARKRKVRTNPPKGIKKGKGAVAADPKNVSAADRVNSFPNEYLTLNYNKNLFCSACREPLALKKSVIDYHIASQKHLKGKEKITSREKREHDIAESLKWYDTIVHPVGETLPEETRVYRVKVVTTMLKSGIPLSKINFIS